MITQFSATDNNSTYSEIYLLGLTPKPLIYIAELYVISLSFSSNFPLYVSV